MSGQEKSTGDNLETLAKQSGFSVEQLQAMMRFAAKGLPEGANFSPSKAGNAFEFLQSSQVDSPELEAELGYQRIRSTPAGLGGNNVDPTNAGK